MMDRMTGWWQERDRREQVLLGIMFALFILVFGWLAVLRPLDGGLVRAREENAEAISRLERVRSDALSLKAGKAFANDTAQAIVSRSANEAGFTPTRLDPQAGGRVIVGLASAKPVALVKWLQALDAQGVFVEQIGLRPNSDATLAVDATLKARVK
jgi:general secretion pathway protein M